MSERAALNVLAGGPCGSLAEAAVHPRRPFMPELVQAKIQSVDRDQRFADVAYYLTARAVMDRFNMLLPGRWHDAYELVEDRQTRPADDGEPAERVLVYRCRLTVCDVTYTDVGEGPDHKAAQSDALKRAVVHIGAGHCVYRIDGLRMFAGPGPHELRRSTRGRLYLDDANHAWLRDRYRAWLKRHGVGEYGLPLDHGAAARARHPALFPDWTRPDSTPTPTDTASPAANVVAVPPPAAAGAPADGPATDTPAEVPATGLQAVPATPTLPPAPPARLTGSRALAEQRRVARGRHGVFDATGTRAGRSTLPERLIVACARLARLRRRSRNSTLAT